MRILIILIFLSTPALSQDLWVRFDCSYEQDKNSVEIYEAIHGISSKEKEYWSLMADAGIISYDDVSAKVIEYETAASRLRSQIKIVVQSGVPYTGFSISRLGDIYPIRYWYDYKGNRYTFYRPALLLEYLNFQIRLKRLTREELISLSSASSHYNSIFHITHNSYKTYKMEPGYLGRATFSQDSFIQLCTMSVKIETFPKLPKFLIRRQDGYEKDDIITYNEISDVRDRCLEMISKNSYLSLR